MARAGTPRQGAAVTATLCTALVCAAVVACYWLHLRAQERIGDTARRIGVTESERDDWRRVQAALADRIADVESRVKRLDVLENSRQMKGAR